MRRIALQEVRIVTQIHPSSFPGAPRLSNSHTRDDEIREIGPVAELSGIAAEADPLGEGGRRPIEHEELVPAGRRDEVVGRRGDRAHVTFAGELGEQGARTHRVPVRRRYRCAGPSVHGGLKRE